MKNLELVPKQWNKISDGDVGTFSLTNGGQYCVYDGEPPVDLIGHRYSGKPVDFSLVTGESVYVLSDRGGFAIGDVGVSDTPIINTNLSTIVTVSASIGNQSNSPTVQDVVTPYALNKYGKAITLINEGVSGSDVADWRLTIDAILDQYEGLPELGVFLHLGGGDIAPAANFLDYGEATRQQKIDDLRYIHQAAADRGITMVQGALTFRNYYGTTIQDTIEQQAAASNGSYSYTRDWIVPIMQEFTPQFLDANNWPLIDMHGMTRNIYEEWREVGSTDYVHPNKFGRVAFLSYMVDSMIAIFNDGTIPPIVNRDYTQAVTPASGSLDVTFGYVRNTYVTDPVQDNINWTIRARPPVAGTEPVYDGAPIDATGAALSDIKMYSYVDEATRNGVGNLSDPTNSTATLLNNSMLFSSLGCGTGSGAMYVIVEGLEANREYNFDIVSIQETDATTDYNCDIEIPDGTNAVFNIDPTLSPPENQIVTTVIKTNHAGQALIASVEQHDNNRSTISGIRIYS